MQKALQVVKKKNRKYVADAVAFIHGLWLALVVSSLPLSFTRKRFRHIGASMIAITVGSWVIFHDCPLYQLENILREKYDPNHVYTGSFTGHYLKKFFGLAIPSKIFTIAGTSYAAIMMMLESYDYIYHHSRTSEAH